MGNHNSLDTYVSITLRLHRDIAERYPEDNTDHQRDAVEIRRRFNTEGMGFLTKTLPSIGKAVDTALGGINPLTIPFLEKREGTQIPKFLGCLISRVFDQTDAMCLRRNVDTSALRDLRTLAYLFYKLELSYDSKTTKAVLDSFIQTEEEMLHQQISPECEPIIELARDFITSVFSRVDVRALRPKHGPGSVATGEKGAEKSSFRRRYASLDWYFPLKEYFFAGASHLADHKHWVDHMDQLDSGTAKIVLVPKDSRGPRIISCEPLEVQWIQQGIMHCMVSCIESHPLTKGHVNFTCQEINRQLALNSSRCDHLNDLNNSWYIHWTETSSDELGIPSRTIRKKRVSGTNWVTLDMKDASDRVSLNLVERLFENSQLKGVLLASRSTATILPDGRRVKLAKFAPMGSAVCFPIEAICFFALAIASLVHTLHLSHRMARDMVYVYGDDIIVNGEVYPIVMRYLDKVGLKFNPNKCCVSGLFRESCGCDAFNGIDVTPLRIRNTWCHHGEQDAGQLVSYVELSNSLYGRGYWRASTYVRHLVESLYGPLPNVNHQVSVVHDIPSHENYYRKSRVIGFYAPLERHGYRNSQLNADRTRYNRDLQRIEITGPIVMPVFEQYKYNGWNELFRVLVCGTRGASPGNYAVPHRSRLKRGWGVL